MYCTIVDEALMRLQAAPHAITTLSRLERDLGSAPGGPIGTDRLRERLLTRPDLFRLIDGGPLPWPAEIWPAEVRETYRRALAAAGAGTEPVVALAAPRRREEQNDGADGAAAVLRLLDATLVALIDETPAGSPDEAAVAQALVEARALRAAVEGADEGLRPSAPPPRRARSTTPPPGPRPGA